MTLSPPARCNPTRNRIRILEDSLTLPLCEIAITYAKDVSALFLARIDVAIHRIEHTVLVGSEKLSDAPNFSGAPESIEPVALEVIIRRVIVKCWRADCSWSPQLSCGAQMG